VLDHFNELMERFLVGLGLAISRLSAEEKNMISLLLAFLLVATIAARALHMAHL
jgi:hypothetical protein